MIRGPTAKDGILLREPPTTTREQEGLAAFLIQSVDDGPRRYGLSPRELEVLALIADGHTNREIAAGMNHMLSYLTEHPERGLLGHQSLGFTVIQYWRSFEHLEAFAKNADDPHLEAWRSYRRASHCHVQLEEEP